MKKIIIQTLLIKCTPFPPTSFASSYLKPAECFVSLASLDGTSDVKNFCVSYIQFNLFPFTIYFRNCK